MTTGPKTFKKRQFDRRNNPETGVRRINVGIAKNISGWLVYVPITNKTYDSIDVMFDKKLLIYTSDPQNF